MAQEHSEVAAVAPAPKKRLWWVAAGAVILIAAIVGVAALTGAFSTPEEPAPQPVVTEEPSPEPSSEPEPEPEPAAVPDPAVVIDSVSPMAYSPVWRPPDSGEAFWQIVDVEYGYPQDGGTDFLLAHACENKACAGDQVRALETGDTLTYMGELYQVQDKWTIMKDAIADQNIWVHDPNRLVIITCVIETTWELSDKNDILIATRVD